MSCLDEGLRADGSCPENGQSVAKQTENISSFYFNPKFAISQQLLIKIEAAACIKGGRGTRKSSHFFVDVGPLVML
jgi:hypothetical protein